MGEQMNAAEESVEIDKNDLYSIVIYQNEEYISGLYQQFHGGKVVGEVVDDSAGDAQNVGAKAGAGGKFLGLIRLDADVNGNMQWNSTQSISRTMTFDQAFYLHGVRQKLYAEELVKRFDQGTAYNGLAVGDFVEFRATFKPNLLASLLDILTPEIVHRFAYASSVEGGLYEGIPEEEKQFVIDTASVKAAQAVSFMEGAQREFRNETSAEYYGAVIGENINVTAVTVCDKALFSGGDSDRILDGEFKVLGKIVQINRAGYSMLDRNKILNRLREESFTWVREQISEKLEDAEQYFDTSLDLQSSGPAFKVIPIAIFV